MMNNINEIRPQKSDTLDGKRQFIETVLMEYRSKVEIFKIPIKLDLAIRDRVELDGKIWVVQGNAALENGPVTIDMDKYKERNEVFDKTKAPKYHRQTIKYIYIIAKEGSGKKLDRFQKSDKVVNLDIYKERK